MSTEAPNTSGTHDCPGWKACPQCQKAAWDREYGDTPILYVRLPNENTTAAEHRQNAANVAMQLWNPIDPESHTNAIDMYLGMLSLHPDTRGAYKNGTYAMHLLAAIIGEPDRMQWPTVLENTMLALDIAPQQD